MTRQTDTAEATPALAAATPLPAHERRRDDPGHVIADLRREFRNTLGSYATGVTVVTALGAEREPIGVTISSFNSVSLDPPLILWSLSRNSPKLEAFRNASHYAVNILSAAQQGLSDRFASKCDDRFAGLSHLGGLGGAPLIVGCCAWFECAQEAHYEGGDHLILLGRVERFARGEAEEPLIFHGARYRALAIPENPPTTLVRTDRT